MAISTGAGADSPRAGSPRAPAATGCLPALPFFSSAGSEEKGGGACLLADGAGAGPPVISDAGRPTPLVIGAGLLLALLVAVRAEGMAGPGDRRWPLPAPAGGRR